MPIYDYLCANCRHLTEVIHGINDAGPRFCPSCGTEGSMKKVLSTPAVHFKGSGWAKKDRSSSSSVRTKAAASSKSDDGGSAGAGGSGGSGESSGAGEKSTGPAASTTQASGASGGSED